MAYEKHDWQTGEEITEPLLDAMEAGIANAYITTVAVNVDPNTGTPSATGSVSGNTLTLDFKNLKGAKGDTGAKGEQGQKGDTGERGPAGPKGDKGETGAQGPKGDKGEPGAGLTGSAVAITELSTETTSDIKNKVNEIITQLKARGVLK